MRAGVQRAVSQLFSQLFSLQRRRDARHPSRVRYLGIFQPGHCSGSRSAGVDPRSGHAMCPQSRSVIALNPLARGMTLFFFAREVASGR